MSDTNADLLALKRLQRIEKEIHELDVMNERLDPEVGEDLEQLRLNVARLRTLQGAVLKDLWRAEPNPRQIFQVVSN